MDAVPQATGTAVVGLSCQEGSCAGQGLGLPFQRGAGVLRATMDGGGGQAGCALLSCASEAKSR